jgi:hypothetical protein
LTGQLRRERIAPIYHKDWARGYGHGWALAAHRQA